MAADVDPMEFDELEALRRWSAVLFCPERVNLARALGVPDPPDRAPPGLSPGAWRAWREAQQAALAREHWENLASRGLVPIECLEADARLFLGVEPVHRPDRGSTSVTYQLATFEHPPTPDAAIALASDMPNVLAVEELTRVWWRRSARFAPAYYRPAAHFERTLVWDLGTTVTAPNAWSSPDPVGLSDSLVAAFSIRGRNPLLPSDETFGALARLPVWKREWMLYVMKLERLDALLGTAQSLGIRWRRAQYNSAGLPTTPSDYATIASPYATALEVFRRGYGLYGFDSPRGLLRVSGVYA